MELPTETQKQILIARERWDFNAHDGYEGCPDEELKYCFVYEFARDSGELQAAINSFRSSGHWPEMILPDNVFWRRGLPYLSFLEHFPEFPDTPWLQIEKRFREERIALLPEYDPPISLVPKGKLLGGRQSKDWTPRQRYTTEVLKINWAYSGDDLTEAFAKWVKVHRPSDFPEDRTHGRTDEREWLKKLGAKRLLEAFGSYRAASDYSARFHTYADGGKATPLYASSQTWNRAAREATELVGGKYSESQAIRLISQVGFSWLPPAQQNKFFPWIGREKPMVIAGLLKLPVEECRERIMEILKNR